MKLGHDNQYASFFVGHQSCFPITFVLLSFVSSKLMTLDSTTFSTCSNWCTSFTPLKALLFIPLLLYYSYFKHLMYQFSHFSEGAFKQLYSQQNASPTEQVSFGSVVAHAFLDHSHSLKWSCGHVFFFGLRNIVASNQYMIMLKDQIGKENKSLLQILSPKEPCMIFINRRLNEYSRIGCKS